MSWKYKIPQPVRNSLRPPIYALQRQIAGWRQPMGSGRLPEVLIIGAQKAGTTSLYDLLVKNDFVGQSNTKEISYFDRFYGKGLDWYKKNFVSDKNLMIDASPDYLFDNKAAGRIAETYESSPKFIVMLRNPTDRAISHYFHSKRLGFERLSLREAIDFEETRINNNDKPTLFTKRTSRSAYSYISRGQYSAQIQNWLSIFPREQFFFIQSEHFYRDPNTLASDLGDFLGLDDLSFDVGIKSNPGKYDSDVDRSIIDELNELFYNEPSNIRRLTGLEVDWYSGNG